MRSVVSVSLPEHISQELKSFALETGRSKSNIIKESVALYLWDVRFNSLKKSINNRANKVGLVTEETVFMSLNNDHKDPQQPEQYEEMQNALKISFGAWKDEDHPELRVSVEHYVRNQRKSSRAKHNA